MRLRKSWFLLWSILAAVLFICPAKSFAYLSDIKVLEKKDISKLSDDAVTQAYLDVIIEVEANNLYHKTAGFTPREYQQYKDLLRYRYELKTELQKRQLDIPVVESNPIP